jgi:hypothetical protein
MLAQFSPRPHPLCSLSASANGHAIAAHALKVLRATKPMLRSSNRWQADSCHDLSPCAALPQLHHSIRGQSSASAKSLVLWFGTDLQRWQSVDAFATEAPYKLRQTDPSHARLGQQRPGLRPADHLRIRASLDPFFGWLNSWLKPYPEDAGPSSRPGADNERDGRRACTYRTGPACIRML